MSLTLNEAEARLALVNARIELFDTDRLREHFTSLLRELRAERDQLEARLEAGASIEFDYSGTASLRPYELAATLSENEAYALAALCKRCGPNECLGLSATDGEAREMSSALRKVRLALEAVDVHLP